MTSKIFAVVFFTSCFASCHSQQKKLPPAKTADSFYTYHPASADGIGKYYFNREIAKVMGASGSAWLERNERQEEENTRLALGNIKLAPTAVVADIGAGTGYYTFRLSPKVPQGKVYAVEIQDEMIQQLQDKKRSLKSNNVEIIKASEQSPNLPDTSIDLAMMVDVYHELEYPQQMLQAIRRSLKKNGKILLLEYRGEDASVPIKPLHKTTVEQLNKEFAANGFVLYFKGDFLPIQHFLLYEKN